MQWREENVNKSQIISLASVEMNSIQQEQIQIDAHAHINKRDIHFTPKRLIASTLR